MSTTPFFRAAGVLLHPTSLPNDYGIGTLGQEAYRFVDFLVQAKQRLWQICPLGPTGYGDSPYQCFSAYAGNPYLIDLTDLVHRGFIGKSALEPLLDLPKDQVDFGNLIPIKLDILHQAYQGFVQKLSDSSSPSLGLAAEFQRFCKTESSWLLDYALYMVIKNHSGGVSWDNWDEPLRKRDPQALDHFAQEHPKELEFQTFLQFIFDQQWKNLRAYANTRGIKIIGDMPIFVAFDSADAWANPELFLFDDSGRPTHVAGVPPDYFSATGQLWGNPLYNWKYLEETGFRWWIDVLKNKLAFCDFIRIDHFRGFSAYWKVPYGEPTAMNGQWEPAPGKKLFTAVKEELGNAPIIAEDLGLITPDVKELIEFCGFPGMKVLQFAFDSGEDNDHLPHTAVPNSLMYTGTHDNTTVQGWYQNAPAQDRALAKRYLKIGSDQQAHWDFIQAALASVSVFTVIPAQDLLGLGDDARFNFPGTLGGNWTWRMPKAALTRKIGQKLAELTELYGRY